MQIYYFFILLIVLSSAFSYINVKYLKLPFTIGLMTMGVVFSLVLILTQSLFPQLYNLAESLIEQLDFSSLILDVMLAFLLFAGALHTDSSLLREERRSVAMSAIVGVLLSTALIGFLLYGIFHLVGIQLDFIYCLLFGSLISPTDPIAVLGILTKAKVPKRIEINIVGESLFNDGVGVVIFIAVLGVIRDASNFSWGHTLLLFIKEAGGGILFGWLLGFVMIRLLKSIDHFETEVMITLSLVMAGYWLAQKLHISGPLAIVVAGLLTGGRGKKIAMSETTEVYVFKFWELVDVLLNAIFFVLIGLRLLTLEIHEHYFVAGLIAIAVVLFARWISVRTAVWLAGVQKDFGNRGRKLLVWGGLRGGLSIALALSLSKTADKDLIVFLTYAVVLFSILVQGLTIGRLAKKLFPETANEPIENNEHQGH